MYIVISVMSLNPFVFAGFSVDTLPVYAKRSQRMVITAREWCLHFCINWSLINYFNVLVYFKT